MISGLSIKAHVNDRGHWGMVKDDYYVKDYCVERLWIL